MSKGADTHTTVGVCGKGLWGVSWVGGGLDWYFGVQGLPVGIQECLERFHRGCVDYLSRQSKWDSPYCESELATARSSFRIGCAKVDAMGNFRRPWVILNMAIRSPRIRRGVRKNRRNCLRAASYGTCRSPFTNFRVSFCTFSSASALRNRMGWVASIAYSRCDLIK